MEVVIGEEVVERDEEIGDCGQSYAPVPQKKWSALFKDSNTYIVIDHRSL